MKRYLQYIVAIFLFSIIGVVYGTAQFDGDEYAIEQVMLQMPEIKVFYHLGADKDVVLSDEVRGYLSGEPLEVVNTYSFQECAEGIRYYILMDISNSITTDYFSAMKSSIQSFSENLTAADQLVILTFGESVEMLLDENESREVLSERLRTLKNSDNQTFLFSAVERMIHHIDGSGSSLRTVGIIISDGEDFAIGGTTEEECLKRVKEYGVPLYGLGVSNTRKVNLDSFGKFIRSTNGSMELIQPQTIEETLFSLKTHLENFGVIELSKGNNMVSGSDEILHIVFNNKDITRNITVFSGKWKQDLISPEIVAVQQISNHQLRITFSEAVANGDVASNYQLSYQEDKRQIIEQVDYYEDDGWYAILTMKNPFSNGDLNIKTTNIYDISMEKNPIVGEVWFHIGEESLMVSAEGLSFLNEENLLIVAIVIVLLIILFIVYAMRKKPQREPEFPPIVENEIVVPEIEITFILTRENHAEVRFCKKIMNTLSVGRSVKNDITIEDEKMSRQHFQLELIEDDIYIQALRTTNGTILNGRMLEQKCKLECGDIVIAGSSQMILRW